MSENLEKALFLCKGKFQHDLILGYESLGGSTRVGKAKKYEGKYQISIKHLLGRLKANYVHYTIIPGKRGGYYSSFLNVL
jgi:hypothetical protein